MIGIGSVVNGKYRLTRLLGDGGMGSVYEAQHAVLGTRVAIKVLHPELAKRTGLVERFLREAQVAAQIRSAHVVQVTDVDRTADGQAYIVMELLEGEPLSSVLDRQRKLPVTTACEYTLQILQALEAAHALGVIHRDLKPENVFVTFAGGKPVLKLIDFGIAKARRTDPQQKALTVAGVLMGTAEYMAPEQARSADKVDARADIYAVGVMLYEMIAGSRPVAGDDARVIALKVERGEIIPLVQVAPDVPREIAGLAHRAMAARPELRFTTATEMRLALERAMGGKRPGTAAMAGTGTIRADAAKVGPAPTVSGVPKAAAAGSLGAASLPRSMTPVEQGHDAHPADDPEPAIHTVRAPPIATALVPPAYSPPGIPMASFGDAPRTRRRRRSPWLALIALPLALGAAIVAVLIGTGTWASSTGPAPIIPAQPAAANEVEPASAATPQRPMVEVQPTSEVPTLAPTRAPPAAQGHAAPAARPPARPSVASADASLATSPPPFVFPSALPSALPSFSSVLPFPTAFPSTFPTAFPNGIPSWPPPMQPGAAAPPSAPTPSGPGY